MPDFVNYNNTDIESNLLVDNNSPGLMSSDDKKKLNGLPGVWYGSEKEYDNLETKDPNTLYLIKYPLVSTLITGKEFNTKLINLARGVTRAPEPGVSCDVIFTNTAIPSDKISSAIIVSTEDSESKVYMYKEDTSIIPEIYICPEIDNGIIYANEDCSYMFNSSLIMSVNLSNLNTSNVTNMTSMFQDAIWISGSITIMNPNITSYSNMFNNCSTKSGSKFTVNYKSGCQTMAQSMVNTRSSNSNVVLGVQV